MVRSLPAASGWDIQAVLVGNFTLGKVAVLFGALFPDCATALSVFRPDKINLRIRVRELAVKFADLLQGVPDLVEVFLDGRSAPQAFVVFQRGLNAHNEFVHAVIQFIELLSLFKARGIFFDGLICDGNRAQSAKERIPTPGAGPEEIQIRFLEALGGFELPLATSRRPPLYPSPTSLTQ